MNAVRESRPARAPAAERAANASPCCASIASRIGPTTAGKPPTTPATSAPQRRPASVVAATSAGASVTFISRTATPATVAPGHRGRIFRVGGGYRENEQGGELMSDEG